MKIGDVEIFQFTPLPTPKGWKRKMGMFGWKGEELFIPACAAGMSDAEAILCLGFDGESACFVDGHVLVPEEWARREKPDRTEAYDLIRRRALEMRAEVEQRERGLN